MKNQIDQDEMREEYDFSMGVRGKHAARYIKANDTYCLIIDTCDWIYLAEKFWDSLDKISSLTDQGKIRLLLPEIILDEWKRNTTASSLEKIKKSFKDKVRFAKTISEYLKGDEADKFKEILNGFQSSEDQITNTIKDKIAVIEHLFDHPSTVKISVTDAVKLQAVDLALTKKVPFHKNKNSMGDALIILSVLDYSTQENLENCIFVSSNDKDFAFEGQVHPDLLNLYSRRELKYRTNIGDALRVIDESIITVDEIEEIEETLQIERIHEALGVSYTSGLKLPEELTRGISAMIAVQSEAIRDFGVSYTSGLKLPEELTGGFNTMIAAQSEAIRDFGVSYTSGLKLPEELTGGFNTMIAAQNEAVKNLGASLYANSAKHIEELTKDLGIGLGLSAIIAAQNEAIKDLVASYASGIKLPKELTKGLGSGESDEQEGSDELNSEADANNDDNNQK